MGVVGGRPNKGVTLTPDAEHEKQGQPGGGSERQRQNLAAEHGAESSSDAGFITALARTILASPPAGS